MNQRVKVKVRPGEVLRFPAKCVNCNKTAAERWQIQRKSGSISRILELPLCEDCHRELNRKSGEEERIQRLGSVLATLAAVLIVLISFFILFTDLSVWIRLFIALIMALLFFGGVMLIFHRIRMRAVHPKKRKVQESVQMVEFSWRATTFEFTNDEFAQQFGRLNEERIIE